MDPRLRELHRTLVSFGFSRDGATTKGIRYTGTLAISGRPIRSAIIFDDLEFARLPRLHLLEPAEDAPELLAHVQDNGEYCYAHRDGHILDHFNVVGSIALSIRLMRDSLERSHTSHAAAEIAAEFPQHWFGYPIYVDIKNPLAKRAILRRVADKDGTAFDFLADTERLLPFFKLNNPSKEQPVDLIRSNKPLTFSRGQKRPKTFADFLNWLSGIDPAVASAALASAQGTYPNQPQLFILAPNATVGVRLDFIPACWKAMKRPQALAHYVDKNRQNLQLTRFTGDRIDPTFIYTRNMNTQPNFSGKTIALVGCGTIGSHLAKMLAQTAAGFGAGARLILFDQQSLTAGNIGRHLLGMPDIGKPKATAVADLLMGLYPELDISAVNDDVLKRLKRLSDNDLVIDATGDEGVANAINAYLIQHRRTGAQTPAVIFAWLFGNGAAAQALCVTSSEDACYRCLRPEHGGQWRFSPLKSGYEMQEVAAQCGEGPFFPYGVAAPVTAAALALQLSLDWLQGRPSPRLRTQRLVLEATKHVNDQDPTKSARCPACGMEPQP
jgi:molybdopterin/thiamine biosynthesis adenylyltransferase